MIKTHNEDNINNIALFFNEMMKIIRHCVHAAYSRYAFVQSAMGKILVLFLLFFSLFLENYTVFRFSDKNCFYDDQHVPERYGIK
jgi:hypothetical protein